MLPIPEKKTSDIYTDTTTFEFGSRESSAWVSETFAGSHARRMDGDILTFSTQQSHKEGGLDVGLSDTAFYPRPVSDVPDATAFCSSYDINMSGAGRWWAGPKISVNWQGDESAKQNGDDWYENYIIEIASSTPGELHDIFTGDYFKAEILPSTILAGSEYKNYKIRFHDWWQFWSVRQDYRDTGTVPIKPILTVWGENGLPPSRQLDGIKANLETYGEISGTGRFRIDVSTTESDVLNCEF